MSVSNVGQKDFQSLITGILDSKLSVVTFRGVIAR